MKNSRFAHFSLCLIALCIAMSTPDPRRSAMAEAGIAFLASLDEEQHELCTFEFIDKERTAWTYLPGQRQGLMVGDLSSDSRALFTALMQSALSSGGYLKAEGVLILEGVLREMQPNAGRDPGKYAITVFGTPAEGPWAWTFEGHHLSLNFTSDGEVSRSTPLMFGVAPAVVHSGPHTGLRILGAELDTARALIDSFTPAQREAATLDVDRPRDVVMVPARKKPLGEVGIKASALNDEQHAMLFEITAEYTGNLKWKNANREHSRFLKLRGLRSESEDPLDLLRFSYIGDVESGLLYYRVTSGRSSFEYAATGDDPDHAHALWRDLDQDFGADLLQEHLKEQH
ncbi:MAG: DUF3500 domain-containing protein [Planctomycetota bacterium]|nr:DUF3500 domain-containing protein [Planctomycetota bacterium]